MLKKILMFKENNIYAYPNSTDLLIITNKTFLVMSISKGSILGGMGYKFGTFRRRAMNKTHKTEIMKVCI